MTDIDPIDRCIAAWHDHLGGRLDGGLDAILHPDCTFYSPIVYTPQQGRDITKLYLSAAGGTLGGDPDPENDDGSAGPGGSFRYVREVRHGHDAVLEFETSIDGTYVNGIDLITCDDEGLIVDFKVMIRPLQAIELVHAQMKTMLERMTAGGAPARP